MKRIILIITLLFFGFAFKTAHAQQRVSININTNSQPVWGPVGYNHVEYYYLPDIYAFYYVPSHQYIYQQQGHWIYSDALPPLYRSYDLYSGYKVVINEPSPYRNYRMYRTKYRRYKGNHSQEAIRNSRDSRYFENKGHPEYSNWKKSQDKGKHDNHKNNGKHKNH